MSDSCKTCRFVRVFTQLERSITGGTHACVRNPPQVHTNNFGHCASGWPLVQEHEWCGEYQASAGAAKENERKAKHRS